VAAVSALFAWVITNSGWLTTKLSAQQQSADKPPAGGAQVLPIPDPAFGGVIGGKAKESKPDFPKGVSAPKDAPNILLIMTDDTGFGASSTFGGPIPSARSHRRERSAL
jgi:arylsulfatase